MSVFSFQLIKWEAFSYSWRTGRISIPEDWLATHLDTPGSFAGNGRRTDFRTPRTVNRDDTNTTLAVEYNGNTMVFFRSEKLTVPDVTSGVKPPATGGTSGNFFPLSEDTSLILIAITSTSSNLFVRFQSDAGHSYSSTYYSYYAFELIFMTNKKNS